LALPGDEDQTLFVYTTAPGSPSHDNLRLLALWAAQQNATRPGSTSRSEETTLDGLNPGTMTDSA
jgi:hypothetical protein